MRKKNTISASQWRCVSKLLYVFIFVFAFVFFLSYLTALLPSLAFVKSVDHFLDSNMLNVMAPLKGVLHW